MFKILLFLAFVVQVSSQTYPELAKHLNPLLENGQPVTVTGWGAKRAELLTLLKENIYGYEPAKQVYKIDFTVFESSDDAFGGKDTRKQVSMTVSNDRGDLKANILIYLPKSSAPVPVFMGYNFFGNHALTSDSEIPVFDKDKKPRARGSRVEKYPIEELLNQGYGIISICYKEIDYDREDEFVGGLHALLDPPEWKEQRPKNAWGSIGAWAWALKRVMDYVETDKQIDSNKVALWGFSRLGKAALWAGAQDERFSLVISHESGCGGAAFSGRKQGESIKAVNRFSHWFCDKYSEYNDKEEKAPFDQHMLLALQAPRPLLVTSAEGDKWSDPEGEFVSTLYASPVYELLGKKGLGTHVFPKVDDAVQGGDIAYYIRTGPHSLLKFDWEQWLSFTDRQFKIKSK
ncbi:MAG: hypothetical protein NE330_17010 [Lentisphaeraceae bacterium]|nr:hypothetical protein [Lentisphaeraceae bacterium]